MPSAAERDNFFKEIASYGKSAILSLILPYNASFMSHEEYADVLPRSKTEQVKSKHSSSSINDTIAQIDKVFDCLQVNAKEGEAVENATRNQSQSEMWYTQRVVRITASKFKVACYTNQENPSKSLIKMVCYPESHRFTSVATKGN